MSPLPKKSGVSVFDFGKELVIDMVEINSAPDEVMNDTWKTNAGKDKNP